MTSPPATVQNAATVGLVGAGHMGSGLGHALRSGGHEVVTTLHGRSDRTGRLVQEVGLTVLPTLADVVAAASVILVVTPPDAAPAAAADIATACATTRSRPLVADLNAISPSTVDDIAGVLGRAGLDLVDGSISGPPPTVRPGARIYLSGPRVAEAARLSWRDVEPIVVGPRVGTASAVKMCTASVYKGMVGLFAQAMRAAEHYGVLEPVLADLALGGHDPTPAVAVAVTKAARFVPEMQAISATQAAAGLSASLFEAFAEVYAQLAATELATADPESVDRRMSARELLGRLTT
jgi:3-hydroxyisobutyrate dehydrogenase-like beta-hydroxyacid dehydrogenase